MEILNFFFLRNFYMNSIVASSVDIGKKIDSRFDWTVVKFYSTPLFYIQDV